MDEKLFRYLQERNYNRREAITDFLSSGGAKDVAEYREAVGVIKGLLQANQDLEELFDRMKEFENE
jgi:uncharacterized protein (UPF0297 family)